MSRNERNRHLHVRSGLALAMLLSGCETTPEREAPVAAAPKPVREFSKAPVDTTLRILHTSDNESDILAEPGSSQGGIARVEGIVDHLAHDDMPAVVLAAGDTFMPAPELKVTVDDKNPVLVSNNRIGYRASALGNHEFDLGEEFLADAIKSASFPYLSANLTPTAGPLAALVVEQPGDDRSVWLEDHAGHVLKRGKLCVGKREGAGDAASCDGVVLGVVGSTTPILRSISSVSEAVVIEDTFEKTGAAIQREVDALEREGVHRIVLLSHFQGVGAELALAEKLHGVDVIVAGGGDNRLADSADRLLPGDEADPVCEEEDESCYPLVRFGADDKPTLVVATDGQLRYVGRLDVSFDKDGVLTGFARKASKPLPVDDETLAELGVTRDAEALVYEARVREVLAPLNAPFAEASAYLDGNRESVRNRETNLGDLAADSMMWAAASSKSGKGVLFAVRNGGGIRAPIGAIDEKTGDRLGGPVRPIDVQSALRFDNELVVVETSHAVLKRAFESSMREVGTSRGHFPQVSREVELVYDPGHAEQTHTVENGNITGLGCPGSRIRSLRIRTGPDTFVDVVKDGALPTPTASIKFVTLSFLANGGDGWFPGAQNRLKTRPLVADGEKEAIREQDALIAFIKSEEAAGVWEKGAAYPALDETAITKHPRIRRVEHPNTRVRPCP